MHPTAVFAHKHIPPDVLEDAIFAFGERVAMGAGYWGVANRCRSSKPAPRSPAPLAIRTLFPKPDESAVDFAVRIAGDLDETVLAIQGPPGSGKTYSGGEMICDLMRQGKKVGVTAGSHKVIRNLLDAVGKAGRKIGLAVKLGHRKTADDDDDDDEGSVATFDSNEAAVDALTSGEANVVGGTAWLWACDGLCQSGGRALRRRSWTDVARQRRSPSPTPRTASSCSAIRSNSNSREKGSHPDGVDVRRFNTCSVDT